MAYKRKKSKIVNRDLGEESQMLDLIKIFKFDNHEYVQGTTEMYIKIIKWSNKSKASQNRDYK